MTSLLCNPLFWVAVVPSILLIVIIVLMLRHYSTIESLNRQLSDFSGDVHISHEVAGIKSYVRIIAYIAIAFCVGVAIHYLAVELPRILNNDYTNSHLHNLGVDYLGLIVAIFAIIVTLLVGWQIFSTIKAKEELRTVQKEIKDDYTARIDEILVCCNERKTEITELQKSKQQLVDYIADKTAELNTKLDVSSKYHEARMYFSQALTLMLIGDLETSLKNECYKHTNDRPIRFQYSMSYRYFFEALLYYAQSNKSYTAMESCLSNMKLALTRLQQSNEKFENKTHSTCDNLYDKISVMINANDIDEELAKRIRELHEERTKIPQFDLQAAKGIKVVTGEEAEKAMERIMEIVNRARREEEAARKAAAKNEPPTDEKNSANPDSPTSK